jgi:hypothetical protein
MGTGNAYILLNEDNAPKLMRRAHSTYRMSHRDDSTRSRSCPRYRRVCTELLALEESLEFGRVQDLVLYQTARLLALWLSAGVLRTFVAGKSTVTYTLETENGGNAVDIPLDAGCVLLVAPPGCQRSSGEREKRGTETVVCSCLDLSQLHPLPPQHIMT